MATPVSQATLIRAIDLVCPMMTGWTQICGSKSWNHSWEIPSRTVRGSPRDSGAVALQALASARKSGKEENPQDLLHEGWGRKEGHHLDLGGAWVAQVVVLGWCAGEAGLPNWPLLSTHPPSWLLEASGPRRRGLRRS